MKNNKNIGDGLLSSGDELNEDGALDAALKKRREKLAETKIKLGPIETDGLDDYNL